MANAAERALQLKTEGNAFFNDGNYEGAYEKFSAAIREDNTNAIFYANRAACCMYLNKHLDAVQDATRATELDRTYAKAWARLAEANEAIGNYPNANRAWITALTCLPISLSPIQAEQKRKWEGYIEVNNVRLRPKMPNTMPVEVMRVMQHNMPWHRARVVCDELIARSGGGEGSGRSMESSAWSICEAQQEYSLALAHLDRMRADPGTLSPGMLEHMTNAIIRDSRCFVINHPTFFDNFNLQVSYETSNANGWLYSGPEDVLSDAQARIRRNGWAGVTGALDTTIRAWIMRGYLDANFEKKAQPAFEFYRSVLTVITRGRSIWPNTLWTSAEDRKRERGVIFEKEFEVGVRGLAIETYMLASCGYNDRYPWGLLSGMADELTAAAEGLNAHVQTGFVGIGSDALGGAVVKGSAEALQARACFHSREAEKFQRAARQSIASGEAKEHYKKAALLYQQHAETFPDDDEYRCWNLAMSIDMFQRSQEPISTILPLINSIRTSQPKIFRIWEYSNLALAGGGKVFQNIIDYGDKMEENLRKGEIGDDEPSFVLQGGDFVSLVYDVPDGPMRGS